MLRKLLALAVLFTILLLPAFANNTNVSVPTPVKTDAQVQAFVRSVAVQVLVYFDTYSRSASWYREKYEDGTMGPWKVKYGEWKKADKTSAVAGSGVILFSGKVPFNIDGDMAGATYILTNAHVVEFLIHKESLGSRYDPIDVYAKKDLIITQNPPTIKIKEGAHPIRQEYYVLKTNFVTIKHREDQLYQVRGEVVAFDKSLDVALVQLKNVWGLPYATFRKLEPQVGENIWLCGAPLGIPFSIDRGRINQTHLNLGSSGGIIWNDQVKVDVAAAPGNSGSGIFDANGKLIAELHGVLFYAGNFIEGGILAISGPNIADWLTWNGWAFIVFNKPYEQ